VAFRKTNNRQKPGIIPGKKLGGQPGNRNAAKPVSPLSAMEAILRDFRRRASAAIRAADGVRCPRGSTSSP
jgi:hypothetical protein